MPFENTDVIFYLDLKTYMAAILKLLKNQEGIIVQKVNIFVRYTLHHAVITN